MTKWIKVLFLLAAYYGLLALEACQTVTDNCECPEVGSR